MEIDKADWSFTGHVGAEKGHEKVIVSQFGHQFGRPLSALLITNPNNWMKH